MDASVVVVASAATVLAESAAHPTTTVLHLKMPSTSPPVMGDVSTGRQSRSRSAARLAALLDVALASPPATSSSTHLAPNGDAPDWLAGPTSQDSNDDPVAARHLDAKIGHVVDQVKSHLLNAVRLEVEVLKARIVSLEKKVADLRFENEMLRQYAPGDVLSQLSPSTTIVATPATPSDHRLPALQCVF